MANILKVSHIDGHFKKGSVSPYSSVPAGLKMKQVAVQK